MLEMRKIFLKMEFKKYNYKSVIPEGFEPSTHSLEGCCSIQLSYWRSTLCGRCTLFPLPLGSEARQNRSGRPDLNW